MNTTATLPTVRALIAAQARLDRQAARYLRHGHRRAALISYRRARWVEARWRALEGRV